MRIRKTYQTVVPTGKVLNSESSSLNDTYSCDYINNKLNGLIKTGYILVRAKKGEPNPITAIVSDGYDFLCWLQPASYNSVVSANIEDPLSSSINLWVASGESGAYYNFRCSYLVIKTGIKG